MVLGDGIRETSFLEVTGYKVGEVRPFGLSKFLEIAGARQEEQGPYHGYEEGTAT